MSAYFFTLIGESGDGKTHTAASFVENPSTWPFAVIDTDGGTASMSRVLGDNQGCLGVRSGLHTHMEVAQALLAFQKSDAKIVTGIFDE